MDTEAMTNAQLETAQRTLHRQMKEAKQQKRAIAAELDQRAARAEAEALLAKASPAARQIIRDAGAIPSSESVGSPGMGDSPR
jgi:uncharacterized membrane protein